MTTPAPKSMLRYATATERRSAVVLKDNSILEVKRDGVTTKTHFATYADWLASLPGGEANVAVSALAPTPAVPRTARTTSHTQPTTDAGWMRLVAKEHRIFLSLSLNQMAAMAKENLEYYKNDLSKRDYDRKKARVDAVGGPESAKANYRAPNFRGKPLWILSDGKPEALFFGRTSSWDPIQGTSTMSETPYFFYKGKQGLTFAEAGVPVGADGWPNLWRLYHNQFKQIPKPEVQAPKPKELVWTMADKVEAYEDFFRSDIGTLIVYGAAGSGKTAALQKVKAHGSIMLLARDKPEFIAPKPGDGINFMGRTIYHLDYTDAALITCLKAKYNARVVRFERGTEPA